jgi:hypothetical protein
MRRVRSSRSSSFRSRGSGFSPFSSWAILPRAFFDFLRHGLGHKSFLDFDKPVWRGFPPPPSFPDGVLAQFYGNCPSMISLAASALESPRRPARRRFVNLSQARKQLFGQERFGLGRGPVFAQTPQSPPSGNASFGSLNMTLGSR